MIEKKTELRKQAESKLALLPQNAETLSQEQIQETLYELRLHQIELEMQNEELNRVNQKLETAMSRYYALYDTAPVGYFTVSEKEIIVEANLTASTLFGIDRNAMLWRKITLFIHREDQDIYYLHRKQFFETGKFQICELRMVRQDDGRSFHAHVEGIAARDANDTPVCHIIISDVSKGKRLRDQMHQIEKMESVSRLAGGVAHNFNNMLSVILGYTDMSIEKIDLSNPIFDDLMEIRNAAIRSADLTNQLEIFARKQPIVPTVIDINEAIEKMLPMLHNITGGDIEIIWEPGSDIWPLTIDSLQLDMIITHLLINAKNNISGSGKITIETLITRFDQKWCDAHYGCTAGDYVVIEVRDSGKEIDSKIQTHIFEPFSGVIKSDESNGLEMSMLHGMVKQNGGFINVYSQQGKGTSFTIYLPKYIKDDSSVMNNEYLTKPLIQGYETILLIDNEPMILRIGEVILQSLGYKVIPASSSQDAMRLAEKYNGEFDLVIMDVAMSGIKGSEIAKELLALYPHIRCMFMSEYTANMMDNSYLYDEGIYFIRKPFSRRELAYKIREALIKS
ncbi:MAG: response regulator [Desulfamplus sp.]|nr:response regulator [Desulfamplus sp.]